MSRGARCIPALGAIALMGLAACEERVPLTRPREVPPAADSPAGFARLWSTHCAGCHGADGTLGPARPMNDPLYLASVDDATLRRIIAQGSPPGTLMPAFSPSAGGPLSDTEIDAIISGMRRAWGRTDVTPSPIPYAAAPLFGAAAGGANRTGAVPARGDPERGKAVFDRSCVSCHAGGEVIDPFFLQLVSDQALRSAIIFGRPDLGMPGAAGPFPDPPAGETLSAQDVDDLLAWLAQRRAEDWPPKSIRRGGRP